MGGEKKLERKSEWNTKGSPPRGRGKGCLPCLCPIRTGITPAWAGKRPHCLPPSEVGRDHPRVGGEKIKVLAISVFPSGSPPRGRGKVDNEKMGKRHPGITPAWAGKRFTTTDTITVNGDHPRVGGEKLYEQMERQAGRGSPPRGRGKAVHPLYNSIMDGDHPRVGGEKVVRNR